MSHLQYHAYPGFGQFILQNFGHQQAVRVGDRIECAGQGGWDPQTGEINTEIKAQIERAFENVELCLRDAGGEGWKQVYRVNSYHVPMNDEALKAMKAGFDKWMPDHKPIWTTIGVQRLGLDDMRVEIEVVAHVPKET